MGLIMRRNLMAAKSGPTALDYVGAKEAHDGQPSPLIAMWDGIENVGFAADGYQHDPNAIVWKDLAGSRDLTKFGDCSFGDDFAYIPDSGLSQLISGDFDITLNNGFTLELVVKVLTTSSKTGATVFGLGSMSSGYVRANTRCKLDLRPDFKFYNSSGYNSYLMCGKLNSEDKQLSMSASVDGDQLVVVNGSNRYSRSSPYVTPTNLCVCTQGGYRDYASESCEKKIYCARIYDGVLSDIKRSANYAIDKARFGIP